MYWNGSAFNTPAQNGDSRSSGNIWPLTKKFSVFTTYMSDVTSRNQKPTMPIVASKKKPTKKAMSSETRYASSVSKSGKPSKYPRQMKNKTAYGSAEVTMYA